MCHLMQTTLLYTNAKTLKCSVGIVSFELDWIPADTETHARHAETVRHKALQSYNFFWYKAN